MYKGQTLRTADIVPPCHTPCLTGRDVPLRSSHCTQINCGFWHMNCIVDAQAEVVKERVGGDKWRGLLPNFWRMIFSQNLRCCVILVC